jgi:hypothetical protein
VGGAGERREDTIRRDEARPCRRFGGRYGSIAFFDRREANAGSVAEEGEERYRIGSREEKVVGDSVDESGGMWEGRWYELRMVEDEGERVSRRYVARG